MVYIYHSMTVESFGLISYTVIYHIVLKFSRV